MLRARSLLLASIGLTLASGRANAQRAEHEVEFRANQVEIAGDAGSLDLKGDVAIRSERFRLSGDRLSLRRSPRGVHVDGSGVLALCPCKNPPIAFGLRSADLAPPSDVLLASATLRVFGVPLFWWPYLWLRSPNRMGFLPPFVAYRGEEGLLLGSGFHLPISDEPNSAIDVTAGAYVRGGARVEARVVKRGARLEVAFDAFHGSALEIKSMAATAGKNGSFGALRTDWLMGERGRVALSSLERSVLPSDRFRAGVGRLGSGVFGLSFNADAPRSAAFGEFGVTGPGLSFGLGGALGRHARYAVLAGTQSLHASAGDVFVARLSSELQSAARFGPLVSSVQTRQSVVFANAFEQGGRELRHESRARAALPLARRYGELMHTVAPFAEAALEAGSRVAATRHALFSGIIAPEPRGLALAGLTTALGAVRGSAVSADIVGGLVAEAGERQSVFAARTRADARYLRTSLDGRALPALEAADILLRAELGAHDSVRLLGHIEAARGDTRQALGVFSEDFWLPVGARLDRSGTTAGGRLSVPWGGGARAGSRAGAPAGSSALLLTEAGVEFDVSHSEWLATWGQVRYRHPCRCMSLSVGGARRSGRRGVDVGLNIELLPL
ncbi:MAG: hypothetical protein ACOY0T_23400 [Myxococcota bacterium]